MLEKPNLPNEYLIECLQTQYDLQISSLAFLPLGADHNTAVYKASTLDNSTYFVKLRQGQLDTAAIKVPNYLHKIGLEHVIPTLPTNSGQLCASLPPYNVLLYLFVVGQDGFAEKLTPEQWHTFGRVLKRFHTTRFPTHLTQTVPHEMFSPKWRNILRQHLERLDTYHFADPVAQELATYLQTVQAETARLVYRAEQLAQQLQTNQLDFILCHGDIHGWNLFIDANQKLHIVDWDTLIFAPKERDLMFIGGGLGNSGYTAAEEEAMFFRGYGETEINQAALAYYRYERIVEDIAISCDQIFLSDEGGQDRQRALLDVQSNYRPNGTIARATAVDKPA